MSIIDLLWGFRPFRRWYMRRRMRVHVSVAAVLLASWLDAVRRLLMTVVWGS